MAERFLRSNADVKPGGAPKAGGLKEVYWLAPIHFLTTKRSLPKGEAEIFFYAHINLKNEIGFWAATFYAITTNFITNFFIAVAPVSCF